MSKPAKSKIKVLVTGAAGRMGSNVVRTVAAQKDMCVVGAVDIARVGADAGEIAGAGAIGVLITDGLAATLRASRPDVVVDFTSAEGFEKRAAAALDNGARLVVGTTGIDAAVLKRIAAKAAKKQLGVIVAPNFAIGAVLMMKFAREAARYMPDIEIIELHHDQKADSPSGTAHYTAELIAAAKMGMPSRKDPTKIEKVKGCRGGAVGDVSVHSVRLPGFLAHQEIIFGGVGQTLTIRHDTTSRDSFMPGVALAVRKVIGMKTYVRGLENVV